MHLFFLNCALSSHWVREGKQGGNKELSEKKEEKDQLALHLLYTILFLFFFSFLFFFLITKEGIGDYLSWHIPLRHDYNDTLPTRPKHTEAGNPNEP